jgi:hypothetical protein
VKRARRPEHFAVEIFLTEFIYAVRRVYSSVLRIRRVCHPVPCAYCRRQIFFGSRRISRYIFVNKIRVRQSGSRARRCLMRPEISLVLGRRMSGASVQRVLHVNRAAVVIRRNIKRAVFGFVLEFKNHVKLPFNLAQNTGRVNKTGVIRICFGYV